MRKTDWAIAIVDSEWDGHSVRRAVGVLDELGKLFEFCSLSYSISLVERERESQYCFERKLSI